MLCFIYVVTIAPYCSYPIVQNLKFDGKSVRPRWDEQNFDDFKKFSRENLDESLGFLQICKSFPP